jgi:hypothetical protein
MNAPLRLDHRGIADLLALARPVAAVPVAPAAVAATAPLLFPFAVLARLLVARLLVGLLPRLLTIGELMELRGFTFRRRLPGGMLLRPCLLILRTALLLLLTAVGPWPAVRAAIAAPVAALLLALISPIASLSVASVAALLEAALLLAVA